MRGDDGCRQENRGYDRGDRNADCQELDRALEMRIGRGSFDWNLISGVIAGRGVIPGTIAGKEGRVFRAVGHRLAVQTKYKCE